MLGNYYIFTITPGVILPAAINLVVIILSVKLFLNDSKEKLTFHRFKQNYLKVWLFGTLSTISGGLILIIFSLVSSSCWWTPNPETQLQEIAFSISRADLGLTYYDNRSLLFVLSGVIISFVIIMVVQLLFVSKTFFISKWKRLIFAFVISVVTTPYYYLLPIELK